MHFWKQNMQIKKIKYILVNYKKYTKILENNSKV